MKTCQLVKKIPVSILAILMCTFYIPMFPSVGFALDASSQDQILNQLTGANQQTVKSGKPGEKPAQDVSIQNPNAGTSLGALAIADSSPLSVVSSAAQPVPDNEKIEPTRASAASVTDTVPKAVTNYVNTYLRDKVFNANGEKSTLVIKPSADTTSFNCSGVFACYTVEVTPNNAVTGEYEKLSIDISAYKKVDGLAEWNGLNLAAEFDNPGASENIKYSSENVEVFLDWFYTYIYKTEKVNFPGSNLMYGFTQMKIELQDSEETIFSYLLPKGKKFFSLKNGKITEFQNPHPDLPIPVAKYVNGITKSFGSEPFKVEVVQAARPNYYAVTIISAAKTHVPDKFAELKFEVALNGNVVGPEEVTSYKLWADPDKTAQPAYAMMQHDAQVWFDFWKQLKPNGWSGVYTMTHTILKRWDSLTPSTGIIGGGKMSVPTPTGGRNDYGFYYGDRIELDVPASVNAYADSLRGAFSVNYSIEANERDPEKNIYDIGVVYRKNAPPLPDGQLNMLFFTVKLAENGVVSPLLTGEDSLGNLIIIREGRRWLLDPRTLSNYFTWAKTTQPDGLVSPFKILALTNYDAYNGDHNVSKFTLNNKVYVECGDWVVPEKIYQTIQTLKQRFPVEQWNIDLAYLPKKTNEITIKITPKDAAAPGAIKEIKFKAVLSATVTYSAASFSLIYSNPIAGKPDVKIAGNNAKALYDWLAKTRPNQWGPVVALSHIKIVSVVGTGAGQVIKFSLLIDGKEKTFTVKNGKIS